MEIKHALYTTMRFNFLYVDRYLFRSGWFYPENYIPYNMIRYVVKGNAVFCIDGKEYLVTENHAVYIPEGCRLACRTLDEFFEFYSVRFRLTTQMEAGDFLADYFKIRTITDVGRDSSLIKYFEELHLHATSQNPGKMFRIRGNLELIVAWLAEHSSNAVVAPGSLSEASIAPEAFWHRELRSNQFKQDPRIRVVVDYVSSHPTEKMDTQFLCELAGVSETTLRRLFKQQTGKTLGDYTVELRMQTAARRLLTTDKPISDIAYDVGYDTPNYFTRVFKSCFGISPCEYRKNARI